MNKVTTIFGMNLRALMAEHGTLQRELSNALGFPQSTISSWLTGENFPRAEAIEKIAHFYNVHVSDLFAEPNHEAVSPAQDYADIEDLTRQLERTLKRLDMYKHHIVAINKEHKDVE